MERKLKSGYNSNSFDRFGDDLCQLILSYLPLRYKFLFGCVSKQWRQLIFNEQKTLIIGQIGFNNICIRLPNCVLIDQNYQNIIFEKFKFIREIKIGMSVSNEMVLSIMSNCQYLESIRIMQYMSDNLIETFKRTSISLKHMDNKGLTQVYLPKLETIDLHFPDIILFTDMYWSQIKKIKITINKYSLSDENMAFNDLKQLSRFVKLESLDITLGIYKSNIKTCVDQCFSDIAINCPKLKYLRIQSSDYFKQIAMKVLANFVNLEKLIYEFNNNGEKLERIEDLKNCKKLKYLEIRSCYMNYYNLQDIDTYLPELQTFICSAGRLSDISITSFSKLKHLRNISFCSNFKSRNDCIISMLNDCPELQHIFVYYVEVNNDLIQALVQKAINNPKKMFYFNFDANFRISYFDISIYKQLPKNLKNGNSLKRWK